MKQNIFWVVAGTFGALIALMISNDIAYGQVTENLAAQPVSTRFYSRSYRKVLEKARIVDLSQLR